MAYVRKGRAKGRGAAADRGGTAALFALCGNPNSGKTTLFNALTGGNARVGNWPGVTVERKEGVYRKIPGKTVRILDLPGTYSLSPYTAEEVVTRDNIVGGPDLIINIVDATNLERNLYLTTQLLETDIPVVVAVNFMDVIRREGSELDIDALSAQLGVPAVPISALRADNLKFLMETALAAAEKPRSGASVLKNSPLSAPFSKLAAFCALRGVGHPVFHAAKMLEDDKIELKHGADFPDKVREIKTEFERGGARREYDAEIADIRYKYITDVVKPAVVKVQKRGDVTRSDKIDRVLTHRVWGIPIFVALMLTAFHLIFASDFLFLSRFGIIDEGIPSPGVYLTSLIEDLVGLIQGGISDGLADAGAAPWAGGLLADGLVGGVGAVLSLLPPVLLLFLFLSLLEDTGYMARVAFIMDRALRRFGLSGKAFMPILMGFGCSVPAIMGTRTLDNAREKRMTILLTPFFSCGAKVAIWAALAPAFFPGYADLVVGGVYFTGIATAIIAAIILKKTVFRGASSNFVLELPEYRRPRLKNTALHLWSKMKDFVMRAATIIAAASVAIWFLSSFSFTFAYTEDGDGSMLAALGGVLKYLFAPLGFITGADGWKPVVAILTGFIAKEAVVSTMGVLYGGELAAGAGAAVMGITPLAAFSFMIFNLLCMPCVAAVAAAKNELRFKKTLFAAVGFWMGTAWVVAALIYGVGKLFEVAGAVNIVIVLLSLGAVALALFFYFKRRGKKGRAGACPGCGGGDCGACGGREEKDGGK